MLFTRNCIIVIIVLAGMQNNCILAEKNQDGKDYYSSNPDGIDEYAGVGKMVSAKNDL